MSTVLPPPTPEDVAVLTSDALGIYGWDLSQDGSVVKIGIGPFGDDDKPLLPEIHFRAVVVEGDQTPIVAKRPDLTNALEYEGGSVEDDDIEGWQALQREGTDYVTIRGSGRISFAEARRMGAALIALADQGEAETL